MDDQFAAYEAKGLTMERARQHAQRLAQQAAILVRDDPTARPVALIFTPDHPAVHASVEQMVRDGTAQAGDWVALLGTRRQALALLRAQAPAAEDWLEPESAGPVRRLPVVIAAPFGARCGYEEYEVAAGPARTTRRQPFLVHAMLICRDAFQQAGSSKWCLIGLHDGVTAGSFPCRHDFSVFLSLGDFASGTAFQIRVLHGDEELARGEGEVRLGGDSIALDLGVPFRNMVFPVPGEYRIELHALGGLRAVRSLRLTGAGQ